MIRGSLVVIALGSLIILAGCPPKYPKCENDEHCQTGEFCVNGLCQQCREHKDCPDGQMCNGGRCESKKGFCVNSTDCADGQVCKNNRCVPCAADSECGEGGRCSNGRCLGPNQCTTDTDCPENHECQNGVCVAPPQDSAPVAGDDPCSKVGMRPLPTIYFDFDEFVLSSAATQELQEAVKCLRRINRRVQVEGHCDARGTEEYNLALGDRRARSVYRYLLRLGAQRNMLRPVSKGKLEASGYNESSWSKDRKVVFIWE